jgi:hypothetical protein
MNTNVEATSGLHPGIIDAVLGAVIIGCAARAVGCPRLAIQKIEVMEGLLSGQADLIGIPILGDELSREEAN